MGYPHDIKGQAIYAFVTPVLGVELCERLKAASIAIPLGDRLGSRAQRSEARRGAP